MTPESNLEAAWERALERGQFRRGGDVDAETCASRFPGHNAQELCMQAARVAIDADDDRLYLEHFETAAEQLDAADDSLDSDAPAEGPVMGTGVTPERVSQLEASVHELADSVEVLDASVTELAQRVDRLEDAVLEEVSD